jgi:hypothetical protein
MSPAAPTLAPTLAAPARGHTYVRQAGGEYVLVYREPIAQHTERVRRLNAAGRTDAAIGAALGLSGAQVYGLRRRARPPIPAAVPPGRPRKDPE